MLDKHIYAIKLISDKIQRMNLEEASGKWDSGWAHKEVYITGKLLTLGWGWLSTARYVIKVKKMKGAM